MSNIMLIVLFAGLLLVLSSYVHLFVFTSSSSCVASFLLNLTGFFMLCSCLYGRQNDMFLLLLFIAVLTVQFLWISLLALNRKREESRT
ncbi:MAG: hypothetical protein JXA66_03270 [Oligoflexia bacterium]|nr:hypothetical protein [Oligoflexia bacterium]